MQFIIPGQPQGKGRPKFARQGNFVHTYTPKKTADYEKLIQQEFKIQCGNVFFSKGIALNVSVCAFFEIPKSTSKKQAERMLSGDILPMKKPDIDNIAKVILDALNGVLYADDSQIIELNISKQYGETPSVVVNVKRCNLFFQVIENYLKEG